MMLGNGALADEFRELFDRCSSLETLPVDPTIDRRSRR